MALHTTLLLVLLLMLLLNDALVLNICTRVLLI